jgi:hypothetical protein
MPASNDATMSRLEAAWFRLPAEAVYCGLTAAWLHGLDVDPCAPIEFIVPKELGVTTRSGMAVRRCALGEDEVVALQGFRATSTLRLLLDVSSRLALTEAVVVVDQALHANVVTPPQLQVALERYDGRWGIKKLRKVVAHAEAAAESPMETRLRMVLVLGRLPRPLAQVPLYDGDGEFLGRPDLYYPSARLALEYDGGSHRTTLAEDDRRQNRFVDAGVRLLRFTAGDIYNHRRSVVTLVRAALGSAHTTQFRGSANDGMVHTTAV